MELWAIALLVCYVVGVFASYYPIAKFIAFSDLNGRKPSEEDLFEGAIFGLFGALFWPVVAPIVCAITLMKNSVEEK